MVRNIFFEDIGGCDLKVEVSCSCDVKGQVFLVVLHLKTDLQYMDKHRFYVAREK